MLKVLDCFVGAHDPWLVALAALICSLASMTCIELLRHARRVRGRWRAGWLSVAAVAIGSGIWATHFVAMLAFKPSLPTGYAIGLTVLSLIDAMVLTGAGLATALSRAVPSVRVSGVAIPGGAILGGAIVGVGIAAMHYTGMAAYEVPGRIVWDPALVAASLISGCLLGSAALAAGLSGHRVPNRLAGAALLLAAIWSHHFTAMGAVTIVPDPTVAVHDSALSERWLACGVALASVAILMLAGAALMLDLRDRRLAALERERLNSLADAAVEGLLVCRGETIVTANESFGRLVGVRPASLTETGLSRFLPTMAAHAAMVFRSDLPIEAELHRAEGGPIPVELIARPISYGNHPHYAVAVRDLRARRSAEGRIAFLADHDPLTGLANRSSFHEQLEQGLAVAAATGRRLAVLCLDLDRFKEVNDLFGHAAGDAVLVEVARTVSGLLGEGQVMGRLGGDEFAVLMPCEHAVAAGRLAETILSALRRETATEAGIGIGTSLGINLGMSVGIAVYPDDAENRTGLLNSADTALKRAKFEGPGTYRFFEASMGAQARNRQQIEHDLRHAIARGEMHLVYQPQIEVATGAVIGFEVLLRWQHPERGAVSPGLFIPIAEENGGILQLGEWVLREACREAATWSNPLPVAVNVSGTQIHAPGFVQLVHQVLFETGLRPHRLEIEITETALIRDPARAQVTLRQLKALGVRIAMDDFGTGYSSLSNLRAYPFDTLKIDGSFIRHVDSNAQAAAIVRAVLGLGRGLGMPVVAEGVETAAELSFLRAENCQSAQGYLMGRPDEIGRFAQHTHGRDKGMREGAREGMREAARVA